MPKLGFNGNLLVRCTPEQTKTLLRNLKLNGQQPAEIGRQLVDAACRFLNEGGTLKFPLRVVPGTPEEDAQVSLGNGKSEAATPPPPPAEVPLPSVSLREAALDQLRKEIQAKTAQKSPPQGPQGSPPESTRPREKQRK